MKETSSEHNVKIEILISTMNRNSLSFLKPIFEFVDSKDFDILIINQTSPENILQSSQSNIKVVNSFEKGISKSRNLAIENATGDVCVVCDDDVQYLNGFDTTIRNAYKKNTDADAITFRAEILGKRRNPKYLKYSKKVDGTKELENVCSVEITFKRKSIQEQNTRFNEFFGINSIFAAGEEWLFLNDIKRKGTIYFEKKTILKHAYLSTGAKISLVSFVAFKSVQYHLIYPGLFYFYLVKLILYLSFHGQINLVESIVFFRKGTNAKKTYVDMTKHKNIY